MLTPDGPRFVLTYGLDRWGAYLSTDGQFDDLLARKDDIEAADEYRQIVTDYLAKMDEKDSSTTLPGI
jgi:hypothetical protein